MAKHQDLYDPEWSTRKAAWTFAVTMLEMELPKDLSLDAKAHWKEARGLLYGMYDGRITSGQSRITENLIAVLGEMDATEKTAEPILDLIGDMARAGLSVQGLELTRTLGRGSGPVAPQR